MEIIKSHLNLFRTSIEKAIVAKRNWIKKPKLSVRLHSSGDDELVALLL
jgi:hypothetical protein